VTRLPPPDRPQLLRDTKHSTVTYLLVLANGRRLAVGRYDALSQTVVKRFDPDAHAYRKKPGIGVNVELIRSLEQYRPAPSKLLLVSRDGKHVAEVRWKVVREFTRDVLERGKASRYWMHDDIDLQVLVPWAAFDGRLEHPVPPDPEQPSLELS
jgi:hypothetical protein